MHHLQRQRLLLQVQRDREKMKPERTETAARAQSQGVCEDRCLDRARTATAQNVSRWTHGGLPQAS